MLFFCSVFRIHISGSCGACKLGEQGASILKNCFFPLIKHLVECKKVTFSFVEISAFLEIFCQQINETVMHNLFDIKHLMQHQVKLLLCYTISFSRIHIILCLYSTTSVICLMNYLFSIIFCIKIFSIIGQMYGR